MKKFIFMISIIAMFTSSVQSQIDIKDNTKFQVYKNGDLISNHNTQANAIEKLIQLRRNNSQDTIKIFTNGTITVNLAKNFFDVVESSNDTVYLNPTFEPYSKDTILDGVIANRINQKGVIYYGYLYGSDETYNLIKVKALDTLKTACEICPKLPLKQKINVRFNHIDKNLIDYVEIEMPIDTTFRIVESVLRSYDSTGMVIQTYATEDWIFNHKSADYNESSAKCENWQSEWNRFPEYTAGQVFNYQTPDGVIHAELYRHTAIEIMLDKKCHKIGVENKNTGVILESKVHVNPDM